MQRHSNFKREVYSRFELCLIWIQNHLSGKFISDGWHHRSIIRTSTTFSCLRRTQLQLMCYEFVFPWSACVYAHVPKRTHPIFNSLRLQNILGCGRIETHQDQTRHKYVQPIPVKTIQHKLVWRLDRQMCIGKKISATVISHKWKKARIQCFLTLVPGRVSRSG